MIGAALNTLIGLWLMLAPDMLDYPRAAAISSHIVGPLAASFAAVALWEVTRPCRWANIPLGLWLVIVPLLISHPTAALVNNIACGAALMALSFSEGRLTHEFGGGWKAIWREPISQKSAR